MSGPPILVPTVGGVPCNCDGYDAPHVCSSKGCYSCIDANGNVNAECIESHKQHRSDQTQKIIQGVVRAPSSLFSMNLERIMASDKIPNVMSKPAGLHSVSIRVLVKKIASKK